jgi:hypothetical protein
MAIVEFLPGQLYGGGHLDDKGWRYLHGRVNTILNMQEKSDKPPFDPGHYLLIHKPLDNDDPPRFSWLPETMAQMNQLLGTGHVLYVHDTAGRNRLGFVVTAFYMQRFGLSRDEALRKVREKKSDIKPNKRYMARLAEYEKYLRGYRG